MFQLLFTCQHPRPWHLAETHRRMSYGHRATPPQPSWHSCNSRIGGREWLSSQQMRGVHTSHITSLGKPFWTHKFIYVTLFKTVIKYMTSVLLLKSQDFGLVTCDTLQFSRCQHFRGIFCLHFLCYLEQCASLIPSHQTTWHFIEENHMLDTGYHEQLTYHMYRH